MPDTTIETPDWLREMGTILEELNEGVVVVDNQLRVIFANEALTRMGHFEREERELAVKAVQAKAEALDFFHDPRRYAYATVPVRDHLETWKIRSRNFRLWVVQTVYDLIGRAPKSWVTQCLEEFETYAICEGPTRDVNVRIAELDAKIYLDLGNSQWQVVEISATGWHVLDESPVKFRRPMGMTALPYPRDGADIRDVVRFLNIGEQSAVLFLAWLTHALRSGVPFPILAVSGVQGSGKSTLTRIARDLIDPSVAALTTSPRSERDLAIAASNSHLVAMDNLSEISAQLSDAMCRLSTGGAFRTRELYTNDSEVLFLYRRPLIMNGIEELPIRPDLLDRAILIHAEPIPESQRRDEQTFRAEFEKVRPQILGRMLDVVSTGLRRLPAVRLTSSPRMSDFARWGVAVEQAMGFDPGSFLAAYATSISDAHVASLDSSPIAQAVYRLITEQKTFHGTTLKLLDTLRTFLEIGSAKNPELKQLLRHPRFPKSANSLAAELSRIEPDLKKLGIVVQRGRVHTGCGTYRSCGNPRIPHPNNQAVTRLVTFMTL